MKPTGKIINNIGHSVTFGKTENGMGAVGKIPDWQFILINGLQDMDCTFIDDEQEGLCLLHWNK